MKVKITKRGHVKVDGVKYKARAARSCDGCAFHPPQFDEACQAAPCCAIHRGSAWAHPAHPVIFVKVESNG